MDQTLILNILYIVLILFFLVIGVLLTIILVKVIKILGPINEMVEGYAKVKTDVLVGYSKVKSLVSNVSNVPNMLISKIFDSRNKKRSGK